MYRSLAFLLLLPVALSAALFVGQRRSERAEFTFVSGQEPSTLDPAQMTGILEGQFGHALFEGLTVYDPADLTPRPGVAESWTISADRRTYTFRLRPSAWSDGEPVTAHDFAYSWLRVLNPKTAAEYAYQLYDYIENAKRFYEGKVGAEAVGIKAFDDHTLEVRLAKPTPYFLDLTSFMTYLPVNRRCVERHGDRWTRPGNIISNGPFVLAEWWLNERIRLRKNPRYWDAVNVALNTVDGLAVESANTGFNIYATGGADMVSAIPLPLVDVLSGRPDFHTCPSLTTYFYRFNVTKPPFDDVRVRKAFVLALDKESIVKFIVKGGRIPARTFVPVAMPRYRGPDGLPYDVAEAQRLLADAGYPGGQGFPRVELLFNTSETHKEIAEVAQQMWRTNLGVEVALSNQEWGVFLTTVRSLDYQIARSTWIGDYTDPNTFLDLFVTGGGNNRTGWSNDHYDALVRAVATETDETRRMRLFHDAEKILVEHECPILPIYFDSSHVMFRPHVEGVHMNVREFRPLKAVKIRRASEQ